MTRPFRIVTHRNWLAETFTEFGAVQDWGWDINPDTAEQTIWWAPGAWVACAWASGIRLPLTLCGPKWMVDLPWRYRGMRHITVCKIQDVENNSGVTDDCMVHVKLTEAKLDSFPAKLYGRRHLADTLKQFHIPPDTMIQLSEPVDFECEARFWVAHNKITARSAYLDLNGYLWDHENFDKWLTPRTWDALEDLASCVASGVDGAPGYTLDVGMIRDYGPAVVEVNAAWSSSPYNGDPAGIVEAIVASHDFDGKHPRWRWRPNPVYGTVQPLKWRQDVT